MMTKCPDSEGIMEQDRLRKEAEWNIMIITRQFQATKLVNDKEMTIRKNDLAVFDMILMMTKCPDSSAAAASFLQLGKAKKSSGLGAEAYQVCSDRRGGVELRFN